MRSTEMTSNEIEWNENGNDMKWDEKNTDEKQKETKWNEMIQVVIQPIFMSYFFLELSIPQAKS